MIISHNMMAMNAMRQFNMVSNAKKKSVEKLSSGYRINRSADDAAGLAISEKMRRQIRGLTQASENCMDGVSFCQVADGALNEVHDMLQRINELAIHSANGTNSDEDREYMDQEVQQLKEELDRVFYETSYNELKIWLAPYVPNVSRNTDELDFATYNDTATGHTGGISVYNVRYTWNELGLQDKIAADDTFLVDGTYKKQLSNGEMLELQYKKGDSIDNISRVYRWKADVDGITINENSAEKISWATMGLNTADIQPGTYSFSYHGTDISFAIEDSPSLGKVIDSINGDGLSGVTWQTKSAGMIANQALTQYKQINPTITAANQKYLMDPQWDVVADEKGVRLTSEDYSSNYTDKNWSSFSDIASGKYSISDWGTSTETSNSVSLDDSAVYKYEDTRTGFSFEFKLTDEVSRETAIQAINSLDITKTFSASVTNATAQSELAGVTGSVGITVNTSSMSFGMQNALGRDMYKSSDFSVVTSVGRDANSDNVLYLDITGKDTNYSSAQTARYKSSSFSDGIISTYIYSGGVYTFTLKMSSADQDAFLAASGTTLAEKSENLKGVQSTMNVAFDFKKLSEEYHKTLAKYVTPTDRDRVKDNYIAIAKAMMKNTMTATASKANMTMTYSIDGKQSYENALEMKVNPPKKKIDIQAGSEANIDNKITIEWDPLNISILAMGATNVLSEGSATVAMTSVKNAMQDIANQRSYFGAMQNRMEHTIRNLDNVVENTTAAESQIRDADMAKEAVENSKHEILLQAGQAMLAQANQSSQGVLTLLNS